jgi:hypothetical protein
MHSTMARADANTHLRIVSLAMMLSIVVIWISLAVH